jgi:hypothetical protein
MTHTRGQPYHPMTQGKIERYHRSMKNQILLENYYLPGQLEARLAEFVDYYNTRRYHESLHNLTPADVYRGRGQSILKRRHTIRRKTIELKPSWIQQVPHFDGPISILLRNTRRIGDQMAGQSETGFAALEAGYAPMSRHVTPETELEYKGGQREAPKTKTVHSWVRNATIRRFITIRPQARHPGYGFREAQPNSRTGSGSRSGGTATKWLFCPQSIPAASGWMRSRSELETRVFCGTLATLVVLHCHRFHRGISGRHR